MMNSTFTSIRYNPYRILIGINVDILAQTTTHSFKDLSWAFLKALATWIPSRYQWSKTPLYVSCPPRHSILTHIINPFSLYKLQHLYDCKNDSFVFLFATYLIAVTRAVAPALSNKIAFVIRQIDNLPPMP